MATKPKAEPVKRGRGRPKKDTSQPTIPQHVTQRDLAVFLGVAPSTITAMAKQGIFTRDANGKLDFPVAVAAYFAHKMAKVEEKERPETSADRLRAKRELELERKMAREDREIIMMDEAIETLDEMTGLYLASLSSIPARITNVVRERQRIEAILDEERQRLSDGLIKKSTALRTGIEAAEAGGEDDAG